MNELNNENWNNTLPLANIAQKLGAYLKQMQAIKSGIINHEKQKFTFLANG